MVPALPDLEPIPTEIKLLRSSRPLGTPAEALWKCCGMDAGTAAPGNQPCTGEPICVIVNQI